MSEEAGGSEKRFLENYGNVVRWKGPFGVRPAFINRPLVSRFLTSTETINLCAQEDRLWIADPKAANHILQKSGYLYAKPSENQEISALFNDFGLPSVEGEFSATNRSSYSLIV